VLHVIQAAQIHLTDSAPGTMGAVVQQLFGKDWQSLQPAINPKPADLTACKDAAAALQRCLKSGTAQLVGSAAADLHLPGCDADIVVLLPGLTLANHAAELEAVVAAVKGPAGQQEGFSGVQQGEFSVQCTRKGINADILVAMEQRAQLCWPSALSGLQFDVQAAPVPVS
jgi:hypothetical protein